LFYTHDGSPLFSDLLTRHLQALAWIAVFDVTGNQQYLSTAESIFEDMKAAYGTTPCGEYA